MRDARKLSSNLAALKEDQAGTEGNTSSDKNRRMLM